MVFRNGIIAQSVKLLWSIMGNAVLIRHEANGISSHCPFYLMSLHWQTLDPVFEGCLS
uniref:Uncharacterized protein n=1 Tax=Anguilla anguilla TaxID=7936 RepID=A0A0E9WKW2_ANGAN